MMTKALILLVVVAICCDVTVDGEIPTTTVSTTVIMHSVLRCGKYDSVFCLHCFPVHKLHFILKKVVILADYPLVVGKYSYK